MSWDLYAFTNAFDASITTTAKLTRIFNKVVPLRMFTDSKQVF